jgi:hypothetical protein
MVEGHGGGESMRAWIIGFSSPLGTPGEAVPGGPEEQHGADVDGELAQARPLRAKAV